MRSRRIMPTLVVLFVLFLLVGGTVACQGRSAAVTGTDVAVTDTLRGRLVGGRTDQAFTFEGVESSLLDFEVISDEASMAAPAISLLDPEGKPIDLLPFFVTDQGAATMKVRGVALLRTGTYQVAVTPSIPCDVYYRFQHRLSFPPMEEVPVALSSCQTYPVYVSAPRGGMVTVALKPKQGSRTVPEFKAVEDPWGGRALDPTRRPDGAPAATVTQGRDGSLYLNFTAPIPGRYTVVTGAKPGQEGPALVSTRVAPVGGCAREVYHPNRPADAYGMPAAGSTSDPSPGR